MRFGQVLVVYVICGLTALPAVEAQHEPKLKRMPPEMRQKLFGSQAPKKPEPRTILVPTAEETVLRVPTDAIRTESGLAYRVMDYGVGYDSPEPNDLVTVQFTGWNGRGAIFDDTRRNDEPRTFQVNRASAALAEGLQLMVRGARFQFWANEPLVDGQAPQLLQYEVELLSIQPAPQAPSKLVEIPADAERTPAGTRYKLLIPGRGYENPLPEDLATIHYNGWTAAGELLASSYRVKQPQSIPVGRSFHVFDEALQEMVVGEKRRLWIKDASDLGERYAGPAVFDLELVSLLTKPRRPKDAAEPPADAEHDASGLAYRVLQQGTGNDKPQLGQTVVVHYTTWNRKGELLDSNFKLGRPIGVPLDDKMPSGWNIALQQMTVGEKRRIWIPEDLSFKGQDGEEPIAMVFDVELLSIEE